MKEKIIELKDIAHFHGETKLLDIIELPIYRGEVLVLLGPNGAGKSTLLRVIGLLEEPKEGQVFFHGEDIARRRDKLVCRRKMAMVFQEPLLYHTTVFENVASGLKFRGFARAGIEQRVGKWLKIMGIEHLSDRQADQISGGEAQRASFARALAIEPEVCLLDEPLAGLDHPSRERLQEELQAILHQQKMTTVYVTHDRGEALMLADRVGVVMGGKLCQVGTPEKVFNAPVDEETARFVGVETILPGEIKRQEDEKVIVDINGLEAQVYTDAQLDGKVFLCVRPEDVTLSTNLEALKDSSARNRYRSRVIKIVAQGHRQKVILDCGFKLTAFITNDAKDELGLEVEKEVVAHFKANRAHVIKRA